MSGALAVLVEDTGDQPPAVFQRPFGDGHRPIPGQDIVLNPTLTTIGPTAEELATILANQFPGDGVAISTWPDDPARPRTVVAQVTGPEGTPALSDVLDADLFIPRL